eukprot:scaffold48182_cov19-Tisochrysis_lutea.AAC.1
MAHACAWLHWRGRARHMHDCSSVGVVGGQHGKTDYKSFSLHTSCPTICSRLQILHSPSQCCCRVSVCMHTKSPVFNMRVLVWKQISKYYTPISLPASFVPLQISVCLSVLMQGVCACVPVLPVVYLSIGKACMFPLWLAGWRGCCSCPGGRAVYARDLCSSSMRTMRSYQVARVKGTSASKSGMKAAKEKKRSSYRSKARGNIIEGMIENSLFSA